MLNAALKGPLFHPKKSAFPKIVWAWPGGVSPQEFGPGAAQGITDIAVIARNRRNRKNRTPAVR